MAYDRCFGPLPLRSLLPRRAWRAYLSREYQREQLEPLGKSLSAVSWHISTIYLTVSGATFLAVAFDLASASAAWPLIAANALGAALFLGLSLRGHKALLRLPGIYLMGITALCGALALT